MKTKVRTPVAVPVRVAVPAKPVLQGAEVEGEMPRCEDRIRRKAFELYEARCRGGVEGCAESDWIQAEGELAGVESSVACSSVKEGC